MMLVKLQTLHQTLKKLGYTNESFWVDYLIKIAGYDDEWKDYIERLSRLNKKPFDDWFGGQPRIYFNFTPADINDVPIDEDVELALESHGYQITDYVNGYCQKDGRKFKIGKIIQKCLSDDLKAIKQDSENKEVEIQEISEYWKSINNKFLNSPYRRNKKYQNNLEVVLSQDPHDLAKMSYERDWVSCMELGQGGHYEDIFCEVKDGGFVAYLITESDKNIEKPLARIHIRRFVSKEGVNLAKPEESVYGNEVPGFHDFVEKWVENQNQLRIQEYNVETKGTFYRRKGGEYSDTFDNVFIVPPEDKQSLLNWFNNIEAPDTKETLWEFVDNYFDELIAANYLDPIDFEPGYRGKKIFETRQEAEWFKLQMENSDPYNDWIRYAIDIDYDSGHDYDEDDPQAQEIIEAIKNRYDIVKVERDSKDRIKAKAAESLVQHHLESLDLDAISNLEKYFLIERLDEEILEKIYNKYPELLTYDKFERLDSKLKIKLLKNFSDRNPEIADKLYGYHKQSFKNNLDPKSKKILDIVRSTSASHQSAYGGGYRSYAGGYGGLNLSELIRPAFEYYVDSELFEVLKQFIFLDADSILRRAIPDPEVAEKEYKHFLSYIMHRISVSVENINPQDALYLAQVMWTEIDFTVWEQRFGDQNAINIHDWFRFVRGLRIKKPLVSKLQQVKADARSDVESNEGYRKFLSAGGKLFESPTEVEETKEHEIEKRIIKADYILDCIQNNTDKSTKFKWPPLER